MPFNYYHQPSVVSVTPALGPARGGTTVTLHGSGFGALATCQRVIRLGYIQVEPTYIDKDTMTFKAPAVGMPSTTVVAVSLNG